MTQTVKNKLKKKTLPTSFLSQTYLRKKPHKPKNITPFNKSLVENSTETGAKK